MPANVRPKSRERPRPLARRRTTAQIIAATAAAGGWINPPPYLVKNCERLVLLCNRHPKQMARFAYDYRQAQQTRAREHSQHDNAALVDRDARNCLDMCVVAVLYTVQVVRL